MTQTIKDNVSVVGDLDAAHLNARLFLLLGAGKVPVLSGKGVPPASLGGNGYFYFRSDGGGAGATHIYFKNSGSWTGIA